MVKKQSPGLIEWRQTVIDELSRLNKNVERLTEAHYKEVGQLSERIAKVEVKSGMFGVIGGSIPVVVMLVIEFLSKK